MQNSTRAIVAVAILAAVALAGCTKEKEGGGGPDPIDLVRWTFDEAVQPVGVDYAIFAFWHDDNVTAPGLPGLTWITPSFGVFAGSIFEPGEVDKVGTLTVRAAEDGGPRFGQAGYNATRVTLFAFDATGALVATTADLAERSMVRELHGDFTELDDEVYYLGDAPETPEGTTRLPSAAATFINRIRDEATGLPVGSVVTAFVSEDEYSLGWYLGDLHLTARIDELVHAP